MNITGIIAEYNPFHNGHAYHLSCAKKKTGADFLIAVMSGNFIQRGAPALLDKSVRAKMALLGGADLVIELPPLWSCASAQYFASAGVALLNQLGCVNALCYGCETPDSDLISVISGITVNEPAVYRKLLTDFQKKGSSYASARQKALTRLLKKEDEKAVAQILEHPNNILALEYTKAVADMHSSIKLFPVRRKGAGYHSKSIRGDLISATAIRMVLKKTADSDFSLHEIKRAMPDYAYKLLNDWKKTSPFIFSNAVSQMLHYCLLKNEREGYARFADCTPDFSNKILRHLNEYTDFDSFCMLLKSKDTAYTRISRALLHILLDIQKEDYATWRALSYAPYARILGFKKQAAPLLTQLKRHASIPLITKASDAKKTFTGQTMQFFQKHLLADSIYRALTVQTGADSCPLPDEYRRQLVII